MRRSFTMLVASVAGFACTSQPPLGPLTSSGFLPYPVEGGYSPGTVISIDKHQHVTGALVMTQRLTQSFGNSHLLDTVMLGVSPGYTLNQTSEFKFGVTAIGGSTQGDTNVTAAFDHLHSVQINALVADRVGLASGALALQDVLTSLPCEDLHRISAAMANGGNAVFVTEIERYLQANSTYKFSTSINASARATIAGAVSVGGTPSWTSSSELDVKYTQPVAVGYKGTPLATAAVASTSAVTCARIDSIIGLTAEWTTTDDDKDWDTQAILHVFNKAGIEIAGIACCSSDKNSDNWMKGSTQSRSIPISAPRPALLSGIEHGSVLARMAPNGSDNWDFTVRVYVTGSVGGRKLLGSCSYRNTCSFSW